MRNCYTAPQTRKLEDDAIASRQFESISAMVEAAAGAIHRYLRSHCPLDGDILILCGSGNNGADGYRLYTLLKEDGFHVDVFSFEEEKRSEENIRFSKGIPVISDPEKLGEYRLIVDCVYGFSFHGVLSEQYRALFKAVASSSACRVAVDLPSGITADTGQADPCAFKADLTLALGCYRPAHFAYPSTAFCGKVVCLDTKLHYTIPAQYFAVDDLPSLPPRFPRSNKGSYGSLCVIAGCKNMAGAGFFAAKAGYLSGVGLVKIVTVEENRTVLQTLLPEAVLYTYDDQTPLSEILNVAEHCSAVLIGPGLGRSERSKELVSSILEHCTRPLVVDADGLNLSVGSDLLRNYQGDLLLTPHPGEAARLLGCSIEEILASPLEYADRLAEKEGAVTLLKDAHTVISDKNRRYINLSGNDGMSTAGCGDVLAGIVGALMAEGMSALDAAVTGCSIHGTAGDLAAKKHGKRCMLASHVLECIEDVLRER